MVSVWDCFGCGAVSRKPEKAAAGKLGGLIWFGLGFIWFDFVSKRPDKVPTKKLGGLIWFRFGFDLVWIW